MNQMLKSFVLVLMLSTSLFAKIIESKQMKEILGSVTPDSLVVFDLDNTIMETAQTLGSDQWFDHRITVLKAAGVPIETALKETAEQWEAINRKGKVALVEKSTPEIIRLIQDEGIPTMGLTARQVTFGDKSLSQLEELGVRLDRRTISNDVIRFEEKSPAEYRDGLMSVGGNNKGTLLLKLLAHVNFHPARIIFVDDKVKNVTNVDNALNLTSILSFAFRYGAADAKVAAYDAKLADFQFEYFTENGVVLSDEQAKELMH